MSEYLGLESILQHILAAKNERLVQQKQRPHAFEEMFRENDFVFIAEVKLKSPSAGVLYDGTSNELVKIYEEGGANAISVVTEETYFGGSTQMFETIRAQTPLPLLRKDFIIDEYQIAESVVLGADAVLLIARLVNTETLGRFISLAYDLGITPIVEIYDSVEISKAVIAGAKIVGVNARNLETFSVDTAQALTVVREVPPFLKPLAFSGIKTQEDIAAAKTAGARGVLVGTTLLRSEKPAEILKDLRRTP